MNKVKPLYIPPPYQVAADEGTVILRDGTSAIIRLARPEDFDDILVFFRRLSPESRQRRFFSPAKPDPDIVRDLCSNADPTKQLSLVVIRTMHAEGERNIIATASYLGRDRRSAEFAVAVDDAWQRKGLGTMLLERLAVLAATNGFVRFLALTMADNRPMLDIFHKSGFTLNEGLEDGYVTIDLAVQSSEESVQKTEMRDRISTATSLRPFFKPKTVAVIGASRNPTSVGYRVMEALVMNRFQGTVYPVNPKASVISSIRCYPSVTNVPEPVDLAVVVVPNKAVLAVVDECAERGVKALVVISAGFAEVGPEGRELQDQLVRKVYGYGMRLVGPNCLGLLNTDPEIQLNASFSPIWPPAGRIAMYSQSGALGLAILGLARRFHLGLSNFVSVGNKADVSGNDLLQYWEEDPLTDLILIYLEAFKNPRRFARIARRVSRKKPIVCVKGGRTTAGQRAAGSHTAALAGSDVPVEALFRQTGVIRTENLEEMFNIAAALAEQPLPAGNRMGVVTNAGGPGILCADACEDGGLVLPELSQETQARLAEFLPSAAGLSNPVDMIASAPPEHFRKTIDVVMSSPEVDSVIVIYIPVGTADDQEILKAMCDGVADARAKGATHKPVLVCPMFGEKECPPLKGQDETIPSYGFPGAVARVAAKVSAYAEWWRKPLGMIPDFEDVRPLRAREICQNAIAERGDGWLSAQETREVLMAFGLPVPPGGVATTADEAVEMASSIGFPVAVKLASVKIVHKTEMGGVHLNLRNEEEVRRAFESIRSRLEKDGELAAMDGAIIQPMAKSGVEVMVGVTEDPVFGPLIAFGLGGVHVEILGDVVFRVTPLTDQDAGEMVQEIRGYRLLEGYRGHAPADIDAIQEVLLRISLLVEEIPEVTELDLNPIFAMAPGEGCRIVDSRIRVEPASKEHPARYAMAATAQV